MADFYIINGGSVIGLVPMSGEAQEWVEENVSLEPWQWLGGALYGEPRMMSDLIDGAISEGFTFDKG